MFKTLFEKTKISFNYEKSADFPYKFNQPIKACIVFFYECNKVLRQVMQQFCNLDCTSVGALPGAVADSRENSKCGIVCGTTSIAKNTFYKMVQDNMGY